MSDSENTRQTCCGGTGTNASLVSSGTDRDAAIGVSVNIPSRPVQPLTDAVAAGTTLADLERELGVTPESLDLDALQYDEDINLAAGPYAGQVAAMLLERPSDEPLAMWLFTKLDAESSITEGDLTPAKWRRAVEAFDALCRVDDGLFDAMFEALAEAAGVA